MRKYYRIEKDLDLNYFVKICKESASMSEAARKIGIHYNSFTRIAKKLNCFVTNQSGKGIKKSANFKKIDLKEILEGKHPTYQTLKLKNRLFREGYKDKICEICKNTEWLDKPIALELDHIDGNSRNHLLSNLRIICPNCHATASTYRGANIKFNK